MVLWTVRGQVVGNPSDAAQHAAEITEYIKKNHGLELECVVRTGGAQEIVWVSRLPDLSALEKMEDALQSDTKLNALVDKGRKAGYFDQSTVEWGIWRKIA